MGVESGDLHHHGRPADRSPQRTAFDHVDGGSVRHTSAAEPAIEQAAEGAGAVPVEVFNRMTQLEQQLAEAQARLEHRRAVDRARVARWRESHPDEAKRQNRESVRAYRARQRGAGS